MLDNNMTALYIDSAAADSAAVCFFRLSRDSPTELMLQQCATQFLLVTTGVERAREHVAGVLLFLAIQKT